MKKDIILPESKGVKLAIISNGEDTWDLYLINENHHSIRNILVVTEAFDDSKITSTLRYFLESMSEVSFIKFETVIGEVIDLENVISITYYIGVDIYEKEFKFSKSTFSPMEFIPSMNTEGMLVE
jgi:hypothetical protein